jgi:hypothetical protein
MNFINKNSFIEVFFNIYIVEKSKIELENILWIRLIFYFFSINSMLIYDHKLIFDVYTGF